MATATVKDIFSVKQSQTPRTMLDTASDKIIRVGVNAATKYLEEGEEVRMGKGEVFILGLAFGALAGIGFAYLVMRLNGVII